MSAAFVSVEDLVATLVTNAALPGPTVSQFVGDTDEDVLTAAVSYLSIVAAAAGRPLTLTVLHGDRRDQLTVLPADPGLRERRAQA